MDHWRRWFGDIAKLQDEPEPLLQNALDVAESCGVRSAAVSLDMFGGETRDIWKVNHVKWPARDKKELQISSDTQVLASHRLLDRDAAESAKRELWK